MENKKTTTKKATTNKKAEAETVKELTKLERLMDLDKEKLDNVEFVIVNNTIGSLSFRDSNNVKYYFTKTDSMKDVKYRVIRDIYQDSETLITHGHIIFPEYEVYELLGIDAEIYNKFVTKDEIERMLNSGDAEKIREILADAPLNIKEKFAIHAKGKVDSRKVEKAIEEATGFKLQEELL